MVKFDEEAVASVRRGLTGRVERNGLTSMMCCDEVGFRLWYRGGARREHAGSGLASMRVRLTLWFFGGARGVGGSSLEAVRAPRSRATLTDCTLSWPFVEWSSSQAAERTEKPTRRHQANLVGFRGPRDSFSAQLTPLVAARAGCSHLRHGVRFACPTDPTNKHGARRASNVPEGTIIGHQIYRNNVKQRLSH